MVRIKKNLLEFFKHRHKKLAVFVFIRIVQQQRIRDSPVRVMNSLKANSNLRSVTGLDKREGTADGSVVVVVVVWLILSGSFFYEGSGIFIAQFNGYGLLTDVSNCLMML